MRKIYLFIIALSLCGGITAVAQKKRTTAKKQPTKTEEVEITKEMERLMSMELATQDIIVIDSIVVGKKAFLDYFRLSKDVGTIMSIADFQKKKGSDTAFVYINEVGDKCYYAQSSNGRTTLCSSNLIGDEWDSPTLLHGIDASTYTMQNYPFVMADGITLYFAAGGEESIGGYDIFVTRYDSESDRYFKPENIGMPFNSPANDYMYVIDENNNIGWFASDRNQPKDTVCIYTFIPTDTRTTYSNQIYTEEQIRSLARLTHIADTWKDGRERNEAMKRLAGINVAASDGKRETAMHFMINDRITYTALEQFTVMANVERFINVQKMKAQHTDYQTKTTQYRNNYAKASDKERQDLRSEILSAERAMEQLELEIKKTEKEIRNAEIKNLSK